MSTLSVGTIKSASSAAPVFQNSSGTEKGQLGKVWVNLQGNGTAAIRDSFNVSSITDNATGDFTMNFSNAMPDANYGCFGACGHNDTNPNIGITSSGTGQAPTTTSMRWCVCVNYNSSLSDEKRITMAIIR